MVLWELRIHDSADSAAHLQVLKVALDLMNACYSFVDLMHHLFELQGDLGLLNVDLVRYLMLLVVRLEIDSWGFAAQIRAAHVLHWDLLRVRHLSQTLDWDLTPILDQQQCSF